MKTFVTLIMICLLVGCSGPYPRSRVTGEILDAESKCIDHGGVRDFIMDTTLSYYGPITGVECNDEYRTGIAAPRPSASK